MGIRHIGQENARLISKNLKHPDNFFNLSDKNHFADLSNIDGIGDTQINSLKNFFSNKNSIVVLKDLRKILEIIPEKQRSLSGRLKDFTFMFRGASSFNQDISYWNIDPEDKVTDMFYGATKMIDVRKVNYQNEDT